jgi:hypothetical protein
MSRYRYNRQLTPPAPFVHVSVRGTLERTATAESPTQVDAAADLTIIPTRSLKGGESPSPISRSDCP